MFDTHCHLTDPQFTKDLSEVLSRAKEVGVKKIINVGYDIKTSKAALTMSKGIKWLLPAVGIHPNETAAESIKQMKNIEETLEKGKVFAIGETGLDYYRDLWPRDTQQELFRKHINIAKMNNLPLLIHTRNSIDDAIMILKEENYHCGVFHCYSGTFEQARTVLDMGFYLGFGGILTFSRRTRELVKQLPVNRILLETDAPFLAPTGHRGERNEPSYIVETFNTMTDILNMSPERLEQILDSNATTLFSL